MPNNSSSSKQDTGWFRGEGGAVHEYSLPLAEVYADQVRAGHLVVVTGPDGGVPTPSGAEHVAAPPQLVGPGQTIAARPQDSATVEVWRDYAVAVLAYGGAAGSGDAGDIAKMSKRQLIEQFGEVQSGPN